MASSLEGNKIIASILTAGVIAMGSGFIAGLIYHPEKLAESAFPIEAQTADATTADDGAASEESVLALLASADPAAGEKQANKCTSCHSFDDGGPDKIGPNLWGLIDQPIANNSGFGYSDALASKSGENWTYESLDAFLADPKGWAPGTKMSFGGIKKAQQRADLIAYMRGQSASPAPLPEAPEAADEGAAEGAPAAEESAEGDAPAEESAEGDAPAAAEAATEDTQDASASDEATQAAQAESGGEAAPAADSILGLLASADVAAGEKQAKKCKSCHSFDEGGPNKIGPNLWNVVNQPIAGNSEFKYSKALAAKSGETWDYENLDGYLANPKGWAPGTKMSFAGVKKLQQRADLVAYLRGLSNDPAPLP